MEKKQIKVNRLMYYLSNDNAIVIELQGHFANNAIVNLANEFAERAKNIVKQTSYKDDGDINVRISKQSFDEIKQQAKAFGLDEKV